MKKLLKQLVLALAVLSLFLAAAPVRAQEAAALAVNGYLSTLPKDFNTISTAAVQAKLDAGEPIFVLDVREPAEYAAGHLEGAKNIPIRELAQHMDALPADKGAPIVVYCKSGHRGAFGTYSLGLLGYKNVKNMAAGFVGWEKEGKPVVK